MNLQFSGKHALILGGSCDLAISLAKQMIDASLFPFLTYRSNAGQNHIKEELNLSAGKYKTIYLDFGNRDSLNMLFLQIGSSLDFLVDFAQGHFESLIASADEDKIYRYFTENISFRAEILKRAGRAMLKNKRGRLVFISSSAARITNPGQGFYAASKLASEAIYRNLGLELGERGITTVSIRPGYIDAGRGRLFLQASKKDILSKIPVKRALSADEAAKTILFYLSDISRGFNATEISLDGGLTAGK
ncbi:hypothetical protein DRJ25_03790 [Candidatus Woesearchaeota archaeon]|nr:MAG: hypothetical protein DRJ25_03790 [Candidatus Woesearchaeota archaeon]